MKRNISLTSSPNSSQAGFALVASISIMAVLVLIGVSLFSLSSVATKSADIASARTEAQANAKMALMQAIGELQKLAGPDTRITAPAEILDRNNEQDIASLVGVWRSWEGSNHSTSRQATGRPTVPNYNSKIQSEDSGGRFLGWLVSGDYSEVRDPSKAADLVSKTATGDTVPLLATGTLGPDSNREVHIALRDVESGDSNGKYAWWASGENQKAHLPQPQDPSDENYPTTLAEWSDRMKSDSIPDPVVFGLDSLFSNPADAEKVATRDTMGLLDSNAAQMGAFFHDLTPYSVGLLTNVATGGWKKDLSLFSERNDHNNLDLPLFQVTPGQSIDYEWPTTSSPTPEVSLLYPWADYREDGSNAFQQTGAASSWANLVNWAKHYKRATDLGNGVYSTPTEYPILNSDNASDVYDYLHKARMFPIIARVQWILSYDAVLDPFPPAPPPGTPQRDYYYPRILFTPAITLWNPYNVALTLPDTYGMYINSSFPAALKFGFNGIYNNDFQPLLGIEAGSSQYGNSMRGGRIVNNGNSVNKSGNPLIKVRNRLASPQEFKPGEALLYSPPSGFKAVNGNTTYNPGGAIETKHYELGLRLDVGWYLRVETQDGGNFDWISHPEGTMINVQAAFDNLNDRGGSGIVFDTFTGGGATTRHRTLFTENVANAVNPPLQDGDLASVSVEAAASALRPFMSLVYGPRVSSTSNHLASKGFVQSNPFTFNVVGGVTDDQDLGHDYTGADHPVNIHYDFSPMPHSPSGDSEYPNVTNGGNGFIISGTTSGTGLNRGIIAELPVQPIASIVELTNWDMRLENPVPPFGFNLIGNSDASPLIPSNSVIGTNIPNTSENLQHDDSYCANHLLFDDWFVSSIAPDPADSRTQEEVYEDFLLNQESLPNRAYRPISEDQAAAEAGTAATLYNTEIAETDSWQTIASRLEVQGMFNVNSTSEAAWRALLGHARNTKVPYFDSADTLNLSETVDYAHSRLSIAGGDEASTLTNNASEQPEAAQFRGYRVLDDAFLDLLAEKVVEQVRSRGPFLSLAEFVNRQLSSGDLALAGAIQTALNEVADAQGTFATLEALSGSSETDPPGNEEYQYPDAAEGSAAYGLPGWTRQADVLRPLAPILSARDDTFTIRTYGDVRDNSGEIKARAYCEAVVRRSREYLDTSDAADTKNLPNSPTNLEFGRRFEIISFRWLKPEEV